MSSHFLLSCKLLKGSLIGILSLLTAIATSFPTYGQSSSVNPTNGPSQSQPLAPGDRPILQVGSQGSAVQELQALLQLLGFYSGPVDGTFLESTAAAVATFQQAAGLVADGIVGPATWNRLLPSLPGTPSTIPPSAAHPTSGSSSPVASSTTSRPSTSASTPSGHSASGSRPSQASSQTPSRPPQSPTSNSGEPVDLPVLRLGMRGPAVARLQQRLRAIGIFKGEVDGVFGAETQRAVQAAQQRFQLNADGIVGPATWTALFEN